MKNINRNLLIGVGVLIFFAMCYYFSSIVAYVIISWVLAMVGQPLMRFFGKIKIGKLKVGRGLSAILVLLTYLIIIVVLGSLFIPLIIKQASNLAEVEYSEIANALSVPLNQFKAWLMSYGLVDGDFYLDEEIKKGIPNWFQPSQLTDFFSSIISTAGSALINTFSVIFITFFFLKDDGLFLDFLQSIVPTKYETKVKRSLVDISKMLTRYFGGVLIQITFITLFVSIGLSVFGVKNALLIGFFAALINVIPYIGPIIGAAFGVFITITSNIGVDFYSEMLPMILTVAGVFAAMQMLDNFILQPFIFSNSVMAHPLEIFIIILMGAQLNGIVGMVLAIPFYTVLRVVARAFLSEFKLVKKMTERMTESDIEQQKASS